MSDENANEAKVETPSASAAPSASPPFVADVRVALVDGNDDLPPEFRRIAQGTAAIVRPDDWFYGPDGNRYFAAFGPVYYIRAQDGLGFTPRSPSADWFVQVGEPDKCVIFAGCRVHYAARATAAPANIDILYREGIRLTVPLHWAVRRP